MSLNLPNLLTGVRFFGTPILIGLYFQQNYFLAFWLMLLLGLTDWLDGFLARILGQESFFGQIFDPVADKTLMVGMFATLGYLKVIPLWFVILCLARDFLIILGGIAMLGSAYQKRIIPTTASKINTFLQILVILVVTYRLYAPSTAMLLFYAESVLIYTTSLFTIISGAQYAKTFWIFLKNR